MSRRRVVVTGLGVISPVGNDTATAWSNLVNGVSGLGPITVFDPTPYEAKAAGEVHGFTAGEWMDAKAARRSEKSMHFGVAAAKQALADSGFELTDETPHVIGGRDIAAETLREGINPQTKQRMTIPASKTVGFKPGQELKNKI